MRARASRHARPVAIATSASSHGTTPGNAAEFAARYERRVPRLEVQPRAGGDEVLPHAGVEPHLVHRPRESLVVLHAVVLEQERRTDHDDEAAAASANSGARDRSRAPVHSSRRMSAPTTSAMPRHHQQIAGAEHLQRRPSAQPHGIAPRAAAQHIVQRQQRERQELDVHGLDVRHARQRVGVEGREAARNERRVPVAGPPVQHERRRPAGQRQADPERDVVGEDR